MIIVAADGSGTCTRLRDALQRVVNLPISERCIFIKPGIYKEKIRILTEGVTLIGDNPQSTVITFNDYALKMLPDGTSMGTFNSYTVNIAASDVTLSGLSIVNDAGYGDMVGQAVALSADADRFICHNCRLISHQDTLYTGPMPSNPSPAGVNPIHPFAGFESYTLPVPFCQYYHECMIQGDVDFIFGSATAVFDRCVIVSDKYCSGEFGYLTAASTFPGEPFGYVFRHCTITGDAAPGSVFLGRPWRVSARTLFLHCALGAHISPRGWHDWDKLEAHQHSFFGEHNNSGPGSIPEMRPSWVKMLIEEEAISCTTERILGRHDHWDPGAIVKKL